MSKSGEETSTPFIKLNDYPKRERLLTFVAARQRRNSSNKSESFSFFFSFSASISQFRDISLYYNFFVISNERKKSKEDLANSRKVCLFRNVLYSSILGYFLNREIMERKHRRKFRKFFEKNINFHFPVIEFYFPLYSQTEKSNRNEKCIKEYLCKFVKNINIR